MGLGHTKNLSADEEKLIYYLTSAGYLNSYGVPTVCGIYSIIALSSVLYE
jgi:hypothetical protein